MKIPKAKTLALTSAYVGLLCVSGLNLALTSCGDREGGEEPRSVSTTPDDERASPASRPEETSQSTEETESEPESPAEEARREEPPPEPAEGEASPPEDPETASERTVSIDLPVGSASPVLRVEKVAPPKIRTHQQYQYTLRVQNLSDVPLRDVAIYEHVSEGVEIQSSSPPRQRPRSPMRETESSAGSAEDSTRERGSFSRGREATTRRANMAAEEPEPSEEATGTRNLWKLGTLEAGSSRSIEVEAVAAKKGDVHSCLHAEYQPLLCTSIEVIEPEIRVERVLIDEEGSPLETVYACEPFFAKYVVSNEGEVESGALELVDELPDGIENGRGRWSVNLDIASLAPGEKWESEPVELRARDRGTFETRTVVRSGEEILTSSDSQLSVSKVELALTVESPSESGIGEVIDYPITVKNESGAVARETTVTFPLLSEMDWAQVSADDVERRGNELLLGALGPGASKSFTVSLQPGEVGDLKAELTASAECAIAETAELMTHIRGIPSADLDMRDSQDPMRVDTVTEYEVTLLNEGTGADTNVQITAKLPEGMEFVNAEGATEVERQGDGLIFHPLGELKPGEEVRWTVRMRALEPGAKRFEIQLVSDSQPEPLTQMEPTQVYSTGAERTGTNR